MSVNNIHMNVNVMSIRVSVEIKTIEQLIAYLSGFTWQTMRTMVSPNEYGWTLYSDLFITLNYFNNGFVIYKTGRDIGYRGKNSVITQNLIERLKRMNYASLLDIGLAMIDANLMTMDKIANIITRRTKVRGRKPENHAIYKFNTKRIVREGVEKWGGRDAAAERFGVSRMWINHWMNMDVIDFMLHPQED